MQERGEEGEKRSSKGRVNSLGLVRAHGLALAGDPPRSGVQCRP